MREPNAPSRSPIMNMDETGRPGIPQRGADGAAEARPDTDLGAMQDLKPFADQLMAIAQQLREGEFHTVPAPPDSASALDTDAPPENSHSRDRGDPRETYARHARAVYNTRRQRGAIFGNAELFGEPAWDILLDLYIAFVDGKSVSVSSACIGSAAPPTTGLRWLGVLAENELVVREPDPDDQRRVMVRLTERGIEAMDRYFASVSSSK
ncbi:winged helix DNA-binding protein [uncultured Erythrobacter sp.]|uniref:winged helix DNA-binding protein n=1 Tax=uncultured Erythrobacter sp. TaxID=263913 RepID=UPI00260851EC|nr:winged helix DNA-binding protein [uncultured Erythrobacter sp.]